LGRLHRRRVQEVTGKEKSPGGSGGFRKVMAKVRANTLPLGHGWLREYGQEVLSSEKNGKQSPMGKTTQLFFSSGNRGIISRKGEDFAKKRGKKKGKTVEDCHP